MNEKNEKLNYSSPVIESDTIETLSAKLLAATAELTAANAELKRLQKERSEMLSNLSHDLRAPVTAIKNALDLTATHPDAPVEELRETLNLIRRRTLTLEDLIQDMYLLFTVENPGSALKLETIEAAPFFEEYYIDQLANPLYDNHTLLFNLPEHLKARIQVDVQKMLRVLDNLFTNAAKYAGSQTEITLRVALSDNGSFLCIDVADNGIGISAEDLPHIFDRTYTASRARTPGSSTGSGLGLCIVRTIIERFGGSVECESAPGQGTCFHMKLPVV